MPTTTKWATVCSDMAREGSQLLMEDMEVVIIVKSQLVPCVVCSSNACPWKGKVLTCQGLNRVTIMETGAHETLVKEPQKVKLTPRLKDYGREMATQGLKPSRIRNGMARRFGLTESELPTLRQVQWFVSSYSKKNLHRNDDYDQILSQIDQLAYVGLTTKRLLLNAARDPEAFVFHMDATFKLNQVGYPVIVCGISDKCRSFHLMALFITSQRLEDIYATVLTELRRIFASVSGGRQLVVKFVMADAEAAQQNKVVRVFGDGGRLRPAFAASQDVYDEQVKPILTSWSDEEQMVWFRGYFERTWVTSAFWLWQCFHTPSRYATTNNPVEQFNRLIKCDYTLRTKHKIGTLIQLLADCCGHQSVTPRIFKESPEATQQLNARVKDFRRRDLLVGMTPSRSSIDFLLVSPNPDVVRVLSRGCERVYLPELGRSREVGPVSAQMEVNYARMEVAGQPEGGWNVDLSTNSCGCKYYFKFAVCIHVIFALQIKSYTGLDGKRTLVNRSVSRKRRRSSTTVPVSEFLLVAHWQTDMH
ncbi:hypothetical protein PPTG_00257 [Phytophthora nicotianae INRA-310]|uniref:SWIM-type domain-containing protein n=1 Tax=Phytophthora nicotianae (strain INRA-310) TaxID=761204 RepID=W2RER1_PHYN3|nr:hypothetical protein PPTG_00257 [Phytophthora nicotianae INRA-310]ETN23726.1 hypothetical protein PPTG_00257 [Phytophthora nicotianae INRA-310]